MTSVTVLLDDPIRSMEVIYLFGAIYKRKSGQQRFGGISALMYIWLSGLLIGAILAFLEIGNRPSVLIGVSKICFATPLKYLLVILPFLFSAIAVSFLRPKVMYSICGVKAAWFATSCVLLCHRFGQAGWLAYWLFMFCDVCTLPFLYCYWIRNLSCDRCIRGRELLLLLPVLALIVIDYRIISPYAMKFGFF